MLEMQQSRSRTSRAGDSTFDKTKRVGRSHTTRRKKFTSPERNQFRYNMIYNKMNNMLNDKRFIRKGGAAGGENMSLQAKLLMSVPSYTSINN